MAIKTRTYGNFFRLLALLPHTDKSYWVEGETGGRTDSLSELSTVEYGSMTRKMQQAVDALKNEKAATMDTARKRVIASIGGLLKLQGKPQNIRYIKAIALQATGNQYSNFNEIPLQRLNSLYNGFNQQQKDFKNIKNLDLSKPLDELKYMLSEAVNEENYELAQKIKERMDLITEK